MPCDEPYFDVSVFPTLPNPSAPDPASALASPRLVVSNAPETIASAIDLSQTPTLYKCEYTLPANDAEGVLIWPWHKNGQGVDIELQVFISLAAPVSGTCKITDRRVEAHDSSEFDSLVGLGCCLAKVQLSQGYPAALSDINLSSRSIRCPVSKPQSRSIWRGACL